MRAVLSLSKFSLDSFPEFKDTGELIALGCASDLQIDRASLQPSVVWEDVTQWYMCIVSWKGIVVKHIKEASAATPLSAEQESQAQPSPECGLGWE